jgi:NADP-dependent 3-hydroxy acid dehydrogenase YdfG
MRVHDKVAIITGAGTGIGEAIAHKYIFGVNCLILLISQCAYGTTAP